MIEIIGLSGKAAVGKDFLGREVLRPAGFSQWAYAWPLKVQGIGRGLTYDDVFVTKLPAVREFLQVVGTEEGRDRYGANYWIDQAGAWLQILHDNLGLSKFYFTDVRFPNEVELIQRLGGKVVRLELGNRLGGLTGAAALHSSETALDDYAGFDLVYTNSLEKTAWDFRRALEEAGVLGRWRQGYYGISAAELDLAGFKRGTPIGVPCHDVEPISLDQLMAESAAHVHGG